MVKHFVSFTTAVSLFCSAAPAFAAEQDLPLEDDFFSLSLEELLSVEVETRKTKESFALVLLALTLAEEDKINVKLQYLF